MQRPPIDQVLTWFYTEDLEETTRFYRETLGLEQIYDQNGVTCIFRAESNAFLAICQVFGDRKVQPSGTMFTFVTDRVDDWYRYLTEQGVPTRGEPEHWEKENIYTLFAEDPNGYALEFQQFLDPAWPKRE